MDSTGFHMECRQVHVDSMEQVHMDSMEQIHMDSMSIAPLEYI